MSAPPVAKVLEVLSTLYSSGDPQAKKDANRWLQDFQKQPDAWAVADYLIKSKDANIETRLFAAQTFRHKITYDLHDLDLDARLTLRESLVQLLWLSCSGPKVITVQLCLAVADLAIQLPDWNTVVQDIVEKFGKSPETAACLLEFLKVLPEEMSGNSRLPLSDKEYKDRSIDLIERNADEVMRLLVMYLQTSAGNVEIQENAFRCLSSWLRTGDVDIRFLGASPLLDMTFNGLEHEELFDVCADVTCEIIYETRDVSTAKPLIEKICPIFQTMLVRLKEAKEEEDTDRVRGYCRMFIEAGEAYVLLIAQHPAPFSAIMEGIAESTAYNDLDIVKMTFKFWYELTNALTTPHYENALPLFQGYFDALVDTITQHLHYPEDISEWTAEERDEFREFRHEMGDTLKDCCRVLSPQKCLIKPLTRLSALLSVPDQATWQQIEAPIFSLRAMGSEVPADENEVMPQIMEFLSKLPDHPKIRYAATLVISRYSFWTRQHPQFITYQLNFISAGFQNDEVAAASALALKHLCKDCSELLVDYVGQLHPFYINVVKSLPYSDALEVTEAVAHVLAVLPATQLQNALQQFCLPLAQDLHTIVSKDKSAILREDRMRAGDLLEQIGAFFDIIHPEIPLGQPHPCVNFINELWPVFDLCLTNYGGDENVCEQLCRAFRHCIESYKLHFVPLLPQLMERLVAGFDQHGMSVYLWVSHKLVREYAVDGTESIAPCFTLVERLSASMFTKLNVQKFADIPDVIEEYFHLVTNFLDCAPTPLVQNPLISSVFQAGLAGLSMEETKALTAVITFYRRLLGIALSVDEMITSASSTPAIGQNGARIVSLFRDVGVNFVRMLFDGLIYHYHWDMIPDVASIMKSLAQLLPAESSQWMVTVVNSFPEQYMSLQERSEFLENYMRASDRQYWDGWTSKSMFLKVDGSYTTGNVYITEGESVCVVVLLGPIPATSVVKPEEHLGSADSVVMTAVGTTTTISIRLQQHPQQRNAYFAEVQFSHAGSYILKSLNEYRSYFWESPIYHSYRPHEFLSENKLFVKAGSRKALKECDARWQVKGSWINKTDYQEAYPLDYYGMFREAQEDHAENNRLFVADGCRMPLISVGQAAQCLDQQVIHVWGDANVRRNLKAFSSSNRWCKDDNSKCVCNDDAETTLQSYPWAVDPTIPLTLNGAWNIDTNFYFHALGSIAMKDRREEISQAVKELPEADIVLLSVGNEDIPLSRISPIEFGQAFVNLLTRVMEVYPRQTIVVRTPQYFCCSLLHHTSWNSGRSTAFATAVRNTVSHFADRVWLWDVHALGIPDHMCNNAGTSYSRRNVVQIENLLLWNVICNARQ